MYNYLKIDTRLIQNCRVICDHDHGGVMIDCDTEKERTTEYRKNWFDLRLIVFQLEYILN